MTALGDDVARLERVVNRIDPARFDALARSVSDDLGRLERLLDRAGSDERLASIVQALDGDAGRAERLMNRIPEADLARFIDDIGAKGLEKIAHHLTPAEISDWLAVLGKDKMRTVSEKDGGAAMKHYGRDWMHTYGGVDASTHAHVVVGEPWSRDGGVNGHHDHADFESRYINPATDHRIHVHSQRTSGTYTFYDYSMMKADGTGPKAAHHVKTTRQNLASDWATVSQGLNEALDEEIRRRRFPEPEGALGRISYEGVTWEYRRRGGPIRTIYPTI
jgi:hypothetical protein